MGSWLSSIGNAIGSTLRKLQPIITTAAVTAATAYGGPAAGAAAAKLAPVITNLQANALDPKGNPARKAAAQQALQQISQEAATDPAKAQALTAATQAVKNTAVAYHVKDAVDRAAVGDQAAKTEINNLVQAADQGDQGAKSTMEILAVALAQQAMKSEEGAKLWEQITGRGPGTLSPGGTAPTTAGWYDVVSGQTYVGGFWGSVKNALLTVTLTKQTNQFIKDNHLEPYVKMAATAVATAYGGPAAGAAAGALAGPVMSIGVKDEKKAAAAEQSVQRAKGVARSYGPEMGQAADVAQVAIDQTAMTYQMAAIVKAAKLGDPQAQKALADLRAAAAAGDVDAQQAVKLADTIDQELSNAPPPPVGQWHDLSSVVIGCGCTHSVGGWHDITVGQDIAHPLLIAVLDEDGNPTQRQVMWHPTQDQIQAFGGKQPAFYTEDNGGLFAFRTDPQGRAVKGFPGLYTGYRPTWPVMYWSEGQASTRTSGSSTGYMGPAQAQAVIGRWHEIIGAAIDATREQARAHATTKQGNAAGVLLTADGRAMGRGFRTLDAAIDWLQHITRNHRSFTYAAAYEKDRAGNAFIQAEEFGTAAQPMQQVALK
jgi:hypothetical protein